jgi:hypothetical protein
MTRVRRIARLCRSISTELLAGMAGGVSVSDWGAIPASEGMAYSVADYPPLTAAEPEGMAGQWEVNAE